MRDRRTDQDQDWNSIRRDVGQGNRLAMKWTTLWVILGTLLVVGVSLFFLWIQPTYLDRQNEVRRNSFQYEQTWRDQVDKKVADIADIEVEIANLEASGEDRETQISTKLRQIETITTTACADANKIDYDDLSASGQMFYDEHCQ